MAEEYRLDPELTGSSPGAGNQGERPIPRTMLTHRLRGAETPPHTMCASQATLPYPIQTTRGLSGEDEGAR